MMRVLAGIFSFTAILILAGCGKEEAAGPLPVPVKVEIVATHEVRPAWRYSGEIRPDKQVQLAFREAGYVDALHQVNGPDGRMRDVQVGDEVRTGTVSGRAAWPTPLVLRFQPFDSPFFEPLPTRNRPRCRVQFPFDRLVPQAIS